jgi:PAS domain S-box-containing protein
MVSGLSLFIGLFNNLALLIILVAVYGFLYDRLRGRGGIRRQIALGILFAAAVFGCMQVKIPVYAGVLVDQRNGIVIMSGAFGGPVAAAIAAAVAAVYRIILGGKGVPGGVLGIALSAVAGVFVFYRRGKIDRFWKALLAAVAATVFVLPGFLPIGNLAEGWALLERMAIPYGSAISTGLLVGGLLLWNEERRSDSQARLAESERKYRKLFESMIDVSYKTDAAGLIEIVSPSIGRMLGYRPDELEGTPIERLYADPGRRRLMIEEVGRSGFAEGFEADLIKKDGSSMVASINARAALDESGAAAGIEGVARDITRAKRAEEEVRAALADREALLSELYHRTNNNMQLIASYMQLRISERPGEGADGLARALSSRIYAMSLVYEMLYRSRRLSRIDLRDYIEDLVPSIIGYCGLPEGRISASLELESVECVLDTAIPLGLALNEIVGNACDHAFPGGRTGTIRVSLRKGPEGTSSLTVSDDGVGMPPGLDPMKAASFGIATTLNLIRLQLRGGIEIESGPGVTYRISLRGDLYEERV